MSSFLITPFNTIAFDRFGFAIPYFVLVRLSTLLTAK